MTSGVFSYRPVIIYKESLRAANGSESGLGDSGRV